MGHVECYPIEHRCVVNAACLAEDRATKTEAGGCCGYMWRIQFGSTPFLKQLRSAKHRTLIAVMVAARRAAGLTQRQLALKLKRSNSFVWKLEAGERQINVLEFIEIARILGIKASMLMAQIDG